MITVNGVPDLNTVFGRATGTCQIGGVALIQTFLANSVITIQNVSLATITITAPPVAGGLNPSSAHITILRLA